MDGLYVLDFNGNMWKLLVRLLVAAICGFAIGFERKSRSKEAGIRTHTIVSLASCLMMILSKYAFADLGDHFDGARIAAQVVTGIGFLGAGMIVYRKDMLHGLTTAAGIWATAAIGMSFGAGMYVVGLACTFMVIVLQVILHRPINLFSARTYILLKAQVVLPDDSYIEKIKEIFEVQKFLKFKTTTVAGQIIGDLEIATDKSFTAAELYNIVVDNDFIKSVERNEEI